MKNKGARSFMCTGKKNDKEEEEAQDEFTDLSTSPLFVTVNYVEVRKYEQCIYV